MLTHVLKAEGYVDDVIAGRVPACKWVRKACQRHRADTEKAKGDWPYRFDERKAEMVCRLGELLPHVKGELARVDAATKKRGKIKLEPAQCFVLCSLFGWVKKSNGRRRFKRASVYVPRGNAKSTLACIIGWFMFAYDDEPGAEIYCGATSEKQAWEVFGPARKMGEFEPELAAATGTEIHARSMTRPSANAQFEPIIGKPRDGAAPHCAIIDEYHQHLTSKLRDAMKTGMGKRTQPLLFVISTAGDSLSGPCRDDWIETEKLLDGVFEDDTFFGIIWTIDDPEKWTTEDALVMANPLWGVAVNPEVLLADQRAAIRDAKDQADFKTKHLNIWVGARGGWLNMETWKRCGDSTLSMDAYAGRDCWVGLDAASKIDMTSMVVVFRRIDGDGFAVFANHYIPEETAALPQNAHYRKWAASERLIVTPGARVDFTFIEDDLRAWAGSFNVQQLAFDPRELNDFVNRVALWSSFERVEITQGAQFMSEPMKELEAQVAAGTLRHEHDPVLTWMASNVIRKEARGGGPVKYYYPTKAKPENKIDGIVALIMALGRAMAGGGEQKSVYETRGIEAV
jgi:phage terminase large subunit-like protein